MLTPSDRLQIISLWENQTEKDKISKASIGRLFGVTEGSIRKILKKSNYWKNYAGLDTDKIIPKNIHKDLFTGSAASTEIVKLEQK